MLSQIIHNGLFSKQCSREALHVVPVTLLSGRTVWKKPFSFTQKINIDKLQGDSKIEGVCPKVKKLHVLIYCLAKSFSSFQLSVLEDLYAKETLLQVYSTRKPAVKLKSVIKISICPQTWEVTPIWQFSIARLLHWQSESLHK